MVTHTRNSCSAFYPSKCTHTAVNTHPELLTSISREKSVCDTTRLKLLKNVINASEIKKVTHQVAELTEITEGECFKTSLFKVVSDPLSMLFCFSYIINTNILVTLSKQSLHVCVLKRERRSIG